MGFKSIPLTPASVRGRCSWGVRSLGRLGVLDPRLGRGIGGLSPRWVFDLVLSESKRWGFDYGSRITIRDKLKLAK